MAGRPLTRKKKSEAAWAAFDAQHGTGSTPIKVEAKTETPVITDESKIGKVLKSRSGRLPLSTFSDCVDTFNSYVDWLEDNPVRATEYVKSGISAGTSYAVTRHRLPSLTGFCLFSGWTLKQFQADNAKLARELEKGLNEDVVGALEARSFITELITSLQDEGAVAGIYNPDYVAKLRGLRELKDVTSNGKEAVSKTLNVNVLSPEAVDNLQKLTKL